MGEQRKRDDETIMEMALRRSREAFEAYICGDRDAVEEHRTKSRVLLGVAIYADAEV